MSLLRPRTVLSLDGPRVRALWRLLRLRLTEEAAKAQEPEVDRLLRLRFVYVSGCGQDRANVLRQRELGWVLVHEEPRRREPTGLVLEEPEVPVPEEVVLRLHAVRVHDARAERRPPPSLALRLR